MPLNDILITITDGALGNVTVPPASTMGLVGCSSKSWVGVVSTASKQAVINTAGYGPLPELACAIIDAGGSVLIASTPTVTAGAVFKSPATVPNVTAASTASPIVITSTAHGLASGQIVTIAGVVGQTGANGTFQVTVLTANTFSLNGSTSVSAYVSGGTIANTGLSYSGTGTSVPTQTGVPYDDYRFQLKVILGGTIGTGPITFQLSLDQGRTFGPTIALGTASTYTVPQSGLVIAFAAGTLVTGDMITFITTAPLWNDAGVSAAITTIQGSGYNWGAGIYVVGVSAGADATSIEGYLDTLATAYRYSFAWVDARDYKPADATEATWMSSIQSDYSATSCVRVIASGGWYNIPSSIVNQSVGGLPRYRRPGGWALACRSVALNAPQVLLSRVSDGALGKIIVNPSVDPQDGNIYHDERINPGLGSTNNQTGRFASMRTRIGLGTAFYNDEPWTLAPAGSDFNLLPYRQVMDVGATLTHQTLQLLINSSVRLNPNGTIVEKDARKIESIGGNAYAVGMTSVGMISSATFVLSRTDNIATTKTVNATGRFVALGYILEIDVSLGYQSPAQVIGS